MYTYTHQGSYGGALCLYCHLVATHFLHSWEDWLTRCREITAGWGKLQNHRVLWGGDLRITQCKCVTICFFKKEAFLQSPGSSGWPVWAAPRSIPRGLTECCFGFVEVQRQSFPCARSGRPFQSLLPSLSSQKRKPPLVFLVISLGFAGLLRRYISPI